jgi:hypothetical protein
MFISERWGDTVNIAGHGASGMGQWAMGQWAMGQWAMGQWAMGQWAMGQWALGTGLIINFSRKIQPLTPNP